jgi:ABC-type nickel/cobalt efflux system permease component RcnA
MKESWGEDVVSSHINKCQSNKTEELFTLVTFSIVYGIGHAQIRKHKKSGKLDFPRTLA